MIALPVFSAIDIALTLVVIALLIARKQKEREMLEQVIMGLWPQLVALVMIAWLISRLSEKMSQAEKKIEVLFQLFNKMKDDQQK